MATLEQASLFDLQPSLPDPSPEKVCKGEEKRKNVVHEKQGGSSRTPCPIEVFSGPRAASHKDLASLVSHVFNKNFGYRPDGKPSRLSPKLIRERLQRTDYLLTAGDASNGIGYLFGKEIPSSWIESMAVLPLYRRQGIAKELVTRFFTETKKAYYFGCATPNPITAYIVLTIVPGRPYLAHSSIPSPIYHMLKEIQENCFDLRGCSIDHVHFRIETGFSPLCRSDERQWNPRKPTEAPSWWSKIELLPNEFEALLVLRTSKTNSPDKRRSLGICSETLDATE